MGKEPGRGLGFMRQLLRTVALAAVQG